MFFQVLTIFLELQTIFRGLFIKKNSVLIFKLACKILSCYSKKLEFKKKDSLNLIL